MVPSRCAGLLAFFLLLAPAKPVHAQEPDVVLKWVEGVILGPEFGGEGRVCSRWTTSPTLSVFGGSPEEHEVIADTVKHLNEVLVNTPIKRIKLLKPNDETADILLYFAPLEDFPALGKKHNFKYERGNWGFFWTFWKKNEIYKAIVLLASDKLKDKQLRHFALEEITQCLGFMNDSTVIRDSVFYESRTDTGSHEKLSDWDKKLIQFVYNHVQPGDSATEVRAAFKKHWPKK